MIAKMTKYSFILLSGDEGKFLEQVQNTGLLDITRSLKPVDDASAAMLAEADVLKKRIKDIEKDNFARDPLHEQIKESLHKAVKACNERLPWGDFDMEAIDGLSQKGLKMRFYKVAAKKFDSKWASIQPLEVISEDGKNVYFVTVAKTDEEYSFPVESIAAPAGSAADAQKEVTKLEVDLRSREKELSEEKNLLPTLRKEYEERIAELDMYFAKSATAAAAEGTLSTYIGFALTENDAAVAKQLDEIDGLFWAAEPATPQDCPPIEFKNNKFVSMFEFFTDMYGRPAYNGFDPTPYIAIFFTLFFAMCMGDAGYGLVLLLVGFLLKGVKSFAKFSPLVVVLGAATILVGLVFHTVFSVDLLTLSWVPNACKSLMIPSKIAGFDGTMVLALITGIFHLCVAMIVKTVYATRNEGFLNCLSVWGWTLFLVGATVVAGLNLTGVIGADMTKWVMIAIGVVSALGIFPLRNLHKNPLINIGAGLWETYNTATGVLGDVLSYLRLYALGLAGMMLGFAFNDLAKMALGDGGLGWVFFILIVIVGHTLNVAMAALGAFVHPLRLNFLEFFKNSGYEVVGKKYNPLKK